MTFKINKTLHAKYSKNINHILCTNLKNTGNNAIARKWNSVEIELHLCIAVYVAQVSKDNLIIIFKCICFYLWIFSLIKRFPYYINRDKYILENAIFHAAVILYNQISFSDIMNTYV